MVIYSYQATFYSTTGRAHGLQYITSKFIITENPHVGLCYFIVGLTESRYVNYFLGT